MQVGLQQERAIRTRRLLLRSAAEIFDREDYASARLSDVSARAHMSTGALHFHFANKEELAQAVVSEARGLLWRAARRPVHKNPKPLHALTDNTHTQGPLQAWAGVTLFENNGMNNYHSLGNRFFDYIHAGLPQLCVNYPAYKEINNKYNIAVLTSDLRPESLAERLNELLNNKNLYYQLQQNCLKAREAINWQQEEKKLLEFYKNIF